MSQILMEKQFKGLDSRPRVSLMDHTPPASPLYHPSPSMKISGFSPPFTVQSILAESHHHHPCHRRPSFPFHRQPTDVIRPPIHSEPMYATSEAFPISPVEDDVFFSFQKRPYLVAAGKANEGSKGNRTLQQRRKRHHSDAEVMHTKRRQAVDQESMAVCNNSNLRVTRQDEFAPDQLKNEQKWSDIKCSIQERRQKQKKDNPTAPKSISLGFHLPQWAQNHQNGEPNAPEVVSPKQVIPSPTSSTKSHLVSPTLSQSKDSIKKEAQPASGRFRPPPFFSTVKELRQHLYSLGGRNYNVDEPPNDKRTQRLWRAMEKYNTQYSLQHYFFVASLSNRCFEKVERIVDKVHSGLLEGSREHEVNQSYFNFLYGKSEDERFRLLSLLESGEVRIKELMKKSSRAVRRNSAVENNTKTEEGCTNEHSSRNETSRVNDLERQIQELKATLASKNDEILSLQKFNQKLCEQLTCIDDVSQHHKNMERRQRLKSFQ